jgi:hypothetical protein
MLLIEAQKANLKQTNLKTFRHGAERYSTKKTFICNLLCDIKCFNFICTVPGEERHKG